MKSCVPLFLLLISSINAYADGWWLTIPSAPTANGGCGSLTTDSYYWDTQDTYSILWVPVKNANEWSGTIPRGDYSDNIRQYFCTGYVDSMPLGSYCFYQNRQNCNFNCSTHYFRKIFFLKNK